MTLARPIARSSYAHLGAVRTTRNSRTRAAAPVRQLTVAVFLAVACVVYAHLVGPEHGPVVLSNVNKTPKKTHVGLDHGKGRCGSFAA